MQQTLMGWHGLHTSSSNSVRLIQKVKWLREVMTLFVTLMSLMVIFFPHAFLFEKIGPLIVTFPTRCMDGDICYHNVITFTWAVIFGRVMFIQI